MFEFIAGVDWLIFDLTDFSPVRLDRLNNELI